MAGEGEDDSIVSLDKLKGDRKKVDGGGEVEKWGNGERGLGEGAAVKLG